MEEGKKTAVDLIKELIKNQNVLTFYLGSSLNDVLF